jgi:hypothetical protein
MYYSININQVAIATFNQSTEITKLDLIDGCIMEYLQKQSTSNFAKKNFTTKDGEVYYLLCYDNIITQMPLLNIENKEVIGRRIKKLKEMSIINHFVDRKNNNKVYFNTTDLFETFFSYDLSTQKSIPLDSKVDTLSTQKSDHIYDKNINDKNIISNKKINKKENLEENLSMSEIPNNSTCKFSLQVEKKKKDKFIKPTLEEIIAFNEERKANVDCKRFFDYYDLNDWKDKNGNPVSNWKLKFISNWEKNATTNKNNQNNITKNENESNLVEVKNNEINLFKNDSMNNIGLLNIDLSLQEKEKNNNHYDMLFNFYKVIAKEEYVYENDAYIFKKYLSKDEKFKYHIQFIKTNKNLYFSTIKDIINNTKQDENLNKILSFIRKQIILFFDKEIKFDKDFLQKFLLKIESFNFICIHKIFTLNLTYLYSTRAENIKCSREGFVFLKYKEFFNDSNFNEKLNIFLDN